MLCAALRAHSAGSTPEASRKEMPTWRRIVGALCQFKGKLVEGERCLTCPTPRHAIRSSIDVVAGSVTKHEPIRCDAEVLYVFAQHADQDRWDRNRPCGLGRTPLPGVDLMDGTVIGPSLAGRDDAGRRPGRGPSLLRAGSGTMIVSTLTGSPSPGAISRELPAPWVSSGCRTPGDTRRGTCGARG